MRNYLLVLLFQTRCSCVQEIFSRFIISFLDEDKDIHGYSCFHHHNGTNISDFFIKRHILVQVKKDSSCIGSFCCELHYILSSSYIYFLRNKLMNKIKLKKVLVLFSRKYLFLSQNLGLSSFLPFLIYSNLRLNLYACFHNQNFTTE